MKYVIASVLIPTLLIVFVIVLTIWNVRSYFLEDDDETK